MKQSERTNSVCPRCNKPFECGISAGKNYCWCFDRQNLVLQENGERCFCQDCLKELLAEQTAQKK